MCHKLFHSKRAWKVISRSNKATSHRENTDTLTRIGIEDTKQDGLSLLRMLDIFKHQEWNIRIFILEWTIYGLMVSLSL